MIDDCWRRRNALEGIATATLTTLYTVAACRRTRLYLSWLVRSPGLPMRITLMETQETGF